MASISVIACLPTFGMSVVIFALYSDPRDLSLFCCPASSLGNMEDPDNLNGSLFHFSFLILFWAEILEYLPWISLSSLDMPSVKESSVPWMNFSQHFYCAPTFRGKLLQISNYLCMVENGYLKHLLCSKTLSYYLHTIERIHGEEWEGRHRFVLELP